MRSFGAQNCQPSNISGCNNAHAIYRKFFGCKNDKFYWKSFGIFLIEFAQNIDCGYTLEPPRRGGRRGGSNEYPHSMFWSKIKKK